MTLASHLVHTETVVDRKSALPLWAQVLDDLRLRIAAGEFTSRFPTDIELVSHYRVSRHTARDAVRRLQVEGLLERERGRGSFMTGRGIEQPLGTLYSLFRSIEAQGFVQRSIPRYLEERRDQEAATRLECPPDEPLIYIERLRLADDEPIAIDCSWLPACLAKPLLEVDFSHTALYRELATRCHVTLDAGWERIRPGLPSREQRELLGVGTRQSAFNVERLAYQGSTPIEWRHSVVRGDRFAFVARWSAQQLDASFETSDWGQGPGK